MKNVGYVGVRLPKKDVKAIEEKAKEEATDKSTALRELLEWGIKHYNLEKAVDQYRTKKISLGRAAEIAGLPVGEMMDILADRGIPSHLLVEDCREGLGNLEKVFKVKLS